MALLTIYYGKMSYQELIEKRDYKENDLFCECPLPSSNISVIYCFVADIGGTLGLTIGASLLTVVEFIQFAAMKFLVAGKRGNKTEPGKPIETDTYSHKAPESSTSRRQSTSVAVMKDNFFKGK